MGGRIPSIPNIRINIFENVWQNQLVKKFLAILLLSPLIVSDELPKKLFCDVGYLSIQLEFNNNSGAHFVTYTYKTGGKITMENPEKIRLKIKQLKVSHEYIYFTQRVPLPLNSLTLGINRETGGISSNLGDGKCATSEEDLIRYKF